MVRLIMAGFWIILGCTLLVWKQQHPESGALTITGTGISVGWLALALAVYDLARWRLDRSRQSPAITRSMLRQPEERELRPAPEILNPEFNFSDETTSTEP
jgi:hypothetical protein